MRGNPLRVSGLHEAPLWRKFRFLPFCYIDYAQPLNVSTRYAYRVHTHTLPPG